MQLKSVFAASVAKDLSCAQLNEDAWSVNALGTCYALCDGASESYDSQRWARLLTERYVNNPAFMLSWVEEAVAAYEGLVDRKALSWSQQAAFDRGSFASLLGLQLADNRREVEVLAVGDSLACHVRSGILLAAFPYTTPEQFDERPTLLSTINEQNAFVHGPDFFERNTSRTWSIEPGDSIFMLTDAIGQWLLHELQASDGAIQTLTSVQSTDALVELTMGLRGAGRMRVDDTTMLRLQVVED